MSQDLSVEKLSSDIRQAIAELRDKPEVKTTGVVTRVSDGVAWIWGLREAGFSEILEIESVDGSPCSAFALNLMDGEIGAVLLEDEQAIKAGATAKTTGRILDLPVGPELVGRVIDPLGRPLDDLGPIKAKQRGLIERSAPGVLDRRSVHEPLMTGIVSIDSMVPIGRGQRELIIGDRQTGKTAVTVDTMINQHRSKSGVINVYVAIGQKVSKIARLVERLKSEGALSNSIVVATSASDPASLQYLAPYAGTAIGEYFRDNKAHSLVIYDDLSKHAAAYRQMSLLLRRPPGREAFPGDVFYLHSRLLERSAKLSDKLGGGSLTALPIIETQAGDISAYIPTNVISITDGQIFLETDLFHQGVRPAISVGSSVSRVGGAAQAPAIRKISGSLRLDLAQFRELAAFAQFSSDLDAQTKHRIERGQRLTELLKQPQFSPYPLWQQIVMLLAATQGCFDNVSVDDIHRAKEALFRELDKKNALTKKLDSGDKLDEPTQKAVLDSAKKITKDYEEKTK